MPQVTVPDETYRRLARRAAELNLTVEQLVVPILERAAEVPPGPDLSDAEWSARFDELLARAHGRADRYPPGFAADVSRETIYAGCGE